MRIVCVTHAYPRFDGDVSGAFVERLVLALARRGHDLVVVAPADQGRGGREQRQGVLVERVRYAPGPRETLAYRGTMREAARGPAGLAAFASLVIQLARGAARLTRELEADLVHAHWWVPGGLSAWLLRPRPVPYVVTLHGSDVALLEHSGPARRLARRVLGAAGAITAVSPFLAERAAQLAAVDRRRIAVCPMPVETSAFPVPDEHRPPGQGVVTVGRLTAQKRIHLLLHALTRLEAEGRSVRLTVVGDGPERGALERLAHELGLSGVRFVGQVEPARVPDLVRAAAVFAFPAVREGFGLAAAEALLLGVPVIATTDGGGVAHLVPPNGGRLVPPDPPRIARAIAELLDDPGARAAAARAGEQLRARLSPEAAARSFETVFAHVA